MKLQTGVFSVAAVLAAVGACSSTNTTTPNGPTAGNGSTSAGASNGSSGSSNPSGNAGSATTGTSGSGTGTGGSGTGPSCDAATACGGDVVGTWNVSSSCLSVTGHLKLQSVFGFSCPTGDVTGTLNVTGSFTANANGTFKDDTSMTGMATVKLPMECKILSGAPVTCAGLGDVMAGNYYETASCTDDAASGGCTCMATVNQKGSIGHVIAEKLKDGNYTTASNALKITQDETSYGYCVAGSKLTLTPQEMDPTMKGSIVLDKAGMTGTGGAGAGGSGAGGAAGSGTTGGSGVTAGTTGMAGSGTGGTGAIGTRGKGPCDVYAAANTPCVAAYSMVRALSSTYNGPLYQVRNMSSLTNTGTGGMTKDILMLADGYADTASVDTFCMGTTCTVSIMYDQSGNKNDLKTGAPGPAGNGDRTNQQDYEASATSGAVTAGGHKVYPLYMQKFSGYRTPLNAKGTKMPTGDTPEAIYMLADGTHWGDQCCWDFGNVSTNPSSYHTMNTLFFGKGFWGKGAGSAPWFEGDFEGGVWAGGAAKGDPGGTGGTPNPMNPSMMGVNFALGMLKTPAGGKYALRAADISKATDMTTAYNGNGPNARWDNQGGILLGIGGDNSNNAYGTFYEGAIVAGVPADTVDVDILKNVQGVGYKK